MSLAAESSLQPLSEFYKRTHKVGGLGVAVSEVPQEGLLEETAGESIGELNGT